MKRKERVEDGGGMNSHVFNLAYEIFLLVIGYTV